MHSTDTNNDFNAPAGGKSVAKVCGQVDKRAQKILFNTYWSTKGWTREEFRQLSTEDFDYAKSKHVMFDPASLSHDQVLSRLKEAIGKLSSRVVADAFLASLSTHRLDWRSALGSYVIWHALQTHAPTKDCRQCECCGLYLQETPEDFSAMNFERLKWGGVRHLYPAYAMLDLELFLLQQAPEPTSEDVEVFRKLVSSIKNAPSRVSSASIQAHLGKVLKSNKAERDCIVAILGYCGILGTPDHPGFAADFVPAGGRTIPDRRFVDMPYPACWWSRDIGINEDRLQNFFGHVL